MRNEKICIALAHALIRQVLMRSSVEKAYEKIFRSLFPYSVLVKYGSHFNCGGISALQSACDFIYELDEGEVGSASCYSASITVQALAFLSGLPADMLIGLRMSDKKITGHAWVEVFDGSTTQIVNPGRVATEEYQVVKRLRPEVVVERTMFKI